LAGVEAVEMAYRGYWAFGFGARRGFRAERHANMISNMIASVKYIACSRQSLKFLTLATN
jgi:hypothetical protein